MSRALLALVLVGLCGCGAGSDDVGSAAMSLSTAGLAASDIAAVEILVFDGAAGGCARVMAGTSPLDDAGLVLVAHALFTNDAAPKHLSIPAGKPLDFYAEAFSSTSPGRMRLGRGCVGETLPAGATTGVTITISATSGG